MAALLVPETAGAKPHKRSLMRRLPEQQLTPLRDSGACWPGTRSRSLNALFSRALILHQACQFFENYDLIHQAVMTQARIEVVNQSMT